jgi:hypothetical protein
LRECIEVETQRKMKTILIFVLLAI